MPDFDWKALTELWVEAVDREVGRVARRHPTQTFYALAFHAGYAEEEGPIYPPAVGANTVEALVEMHPRREDADFWGVRWNPADWRWPDLLAAGGAIRRQYAAVTRLARDGSRAHWRQIDARQERAVAAAVAELAQRARRAQGGFAKLAQAPDFVVYQYDPSQAGPALARKSIPRATFARLFPAELAHRRERAAIAGRPARDRIDYLISRFGVFEPPIDSEQASEALVKMGAPAVPPLVHALDDPDTGWQAAMILAEIGTPAAAPAIPALAAHARVACSAQMWSAIALGQLGQIDALVALARRRTTQGVAVDGLKHARPASYPALDALLARGDKPLTEAIAEALRPGSASFAKTPTDFEALARAARSPHAVLRTDVAGALGDSRLGERDRARAVPLLVGMLDDRSAEVRRLATLSLGWCRRHARAELPRLRAMKRDRAEAVRNAAAVAIEEITGRKR